MRTVQILGDLTRSADVERTVATASGELGVIDILVHNAGGDIAAAAEAGTLDRIATVDEVAPVVEFFAGPLGAFVSGQVVRIDGAVQGWPA